MLARPSLATLIERAINDIEARFKPKKANTDARLRNSNLNVLARVSAGAAHGLYGKLDFLSRQIIPDLAELEFLDRWASVWGITRLPAAKATGNITATGVNGVNVPMGTTFVRSDGAQFTTTAAGVIAAGTVTVAAEAVVAGAAGNTDAASAVTLLAPIAGVNGNATVAAGGLSGGADVEADDAYRARLIARIQQAPHAGADFDYVTWAKEVAGVTRAWAYPLELGAGAVTVRFVRDNDGAGALIIPDAGEVAAVQAYIDARRPVTAAVTVIAPIADATNFTFTMLAPNTQAVKDAVTAELTDLLKREGKPGGTIFLSHIRQAVSNAAGEDNFTMTVPAADIVSAVGHIPIPGVFTFPP